MAVTWITPSCTKDIYETTIVKDSIVYVIKYDTIRITNNNHDTVYLGQDTIHVSFICTVSYQADSMSYATLLASTTCTTVPSDATYNWLLDGSSMVGGTLPTVGGKFQNASNGTHLLTMMLTCPDIKKVYTVAKTFIINLKS